MKRALAIGLVLVAFHDVRAADLKLAAVFSDHMVLQREHSVPVWGWADPKESIRVSFGDQTKTATADDQGKWMITLDPMPASRTPARLLVESNRRKLQVTADDVLVGEVWLGSGQSNMAMTVSRAMDFEQERSASDLPEIRMFTERSTAASSPQPVGNGNWVRCSSGDVGSFSATLFFFGRELYRELKVPIGLINSSVGGTPIESWISEEAQLAVPELRSSVEAAKAEFDSFDEEAAGRRFERALAAWKEQAAKARAAGRDVPRRPQDPRTQRARKGNIAGLFNGKIAPLIPYAIRGVIWYQGEANSQPGKAESYQYQLPALVNDWRTRWGDVLPFGWVQLPNFKRDGDGWPMVREAMLKSLRLPRTGMAITLDVGDPQDIHPKNKQAVGRRLAAWALGDVYQLEVPSTSGPLPATIDVRGSEIAVKFQHADGGLKAKDGELEGFLLAGEDKQWKPARARIDDSTVIVSSDAVARPVAVRYAWEANAQASLFNGAGFPATPFRTDHWPTASVPPQRTAPRR